MIGIHDTSSLSMLYKSLVIQKWEKEFPKNKKFPGDKKFPKDKEFPKQNSVWGLIELFRLIWHLIKFRLIPDQSEKVYLQSKFGLDKQNS